MADSSEIGLMELATELIHNVALSGWLEPRDVAALAQTCRRMAEVLVWDEYGANIHRALLGVTENVKGQRWKAANYAVHRRWFRGEDEGEETLWKCVVEAVVAQKNNLESNGAAGWENAIMAALSLPNAKGCLDRWGRTTTFGYWETTSLLHTAAILGSQRMVDWVVQQGGDLEVSSAGETPLLVACGAGHLGVVRRLVECGADVMTHDRRSTTVLHAACQGGDLDVVRYLFTLGMSDADARDGYGRRPLDLACQKGHLDVVNLLVDEVGVEVDAKGLLAAAKGGHAGVVRKLMGMVEETDNTALAVAAGEGHVGIVRLLVEEGGADVNKPGRDGKKPLYLECMGGKEELIRILLDAGADVEDACVAVARVWGHDHVVGMLAPT